jgi:hypothetical protein
LYESSTNDSGVLSGKENCGECDWFDDTMHQFTKGKIKGSSGIAVTQKCIKNREHRC